jgi:hypothetical protein
MVILGRTRLACAVGLGLVLAGSTCKVPNEDHCANQEVPGNEFCLELNRATPYCSPCRREYFGCVEFEPFACAGYDREIDREDDVTSSSSGDGSSGSDSSDGDGDSG